ncbi:type II toxin-antitoxin system HigB family toxin [Pseudomonas sp. MWU12-2037]|uniref:type II toxin-antitoxin system HigB family toxin n=1 Tax=Pseudomonas sp. MWU12-2037 TaxID=2928690 RepID=UPI00200CC432|nr:type II toxin-antitoxin system HigB family toxin [Pseudomonas sp. MWU12-2037]
MRIIAISQLKTFWQKHPDSEQSFLAWMDEVRKANWQTPAEIKAQFRHASVLKSRRVVFNTKGNDYRLVVAVAWESVRFFVCRLVMACR